MRQLKTAPTNVAPRNNADKLAALEITAREHLDAMVRSAHTIREDAAGIVAAGVGMADIAQADPAAWSKFSSRFDIKVKGDGQLFRLIAAILFHDFAIELQGDGGLIRRTISRSQISRYGAAIAFAHAWPQRGAELISKVVNAGGVWALAAYTVEGTDHASRLKSDVDMMRVPRPSKPALYVVLPNGEHRAVPIHLARPIIEQVMA